MIVARVVGRSWATVQHPAYDGSIVYAVRPLDAEDTFLALDHVGSGPGDLVLVVREGNGARQVFGDMEAPVHSAIVGIVDHLDRMEGT